MRTILYGAYYVCPVLAIASLGWVIFGSAPWYVAVPLGTLGFFGFGFLGLFAGSLAERSAR